MGYRIQSGLWAACPRRGPRYVYRQGHKWAGYLLVVMIGLLLGILAERQDQHEEEVWRDTETDRCAYSVRCGLVRCPESEDRRVWRRY